MKALMVSLIAVTDNNSSMVEDVLACARPPIRSCIAKGALRK